MSPRAKSMVGTRDWIRMLSLLGVITMFSTFWISSAVCAPGIRDVTPAEAERTIAANRENSNFLLLDIRTPKEFDDERIAGASNVDFYSKKFLEDITKIERGKKVILYCRTGNRSTKALQTMRELGFLDVMHLSTGISGWKADGLPTVRGNAR